MSNPYGAPVLQNQPQHAHSQVRGPATALIVVALIAVICGSIALVLDLVLIASGAVDRLEEMNDGPISEMTKIGIRAVWGMVLVIASSFVLYGAIQMRNLKSYGIAKAAAVVAMIPMLGPCCILGLPFGIWAFVVLGKPDVRNAFK